MGNDKSIGEAVGEELLEQGAKFAARAAFNYLTNRGGGDGEGEEGEAAEEMPDRELVLFKGALNGKEANMAENGRLVQLALLPSKMLITEMIERRAHALRMEPKGPGHAVMFMVDGQPVPGPRFPNKQQGIAMTQMLKLLGGMDIKVRDEVQQGGVHAEFGKKGKYEIKMKVEPHPKLRGAERLTVNCRDKDYEVEDPRNLAFPEDFKQKIRDLLGDRRGVLLVCGPPGSCVTTMMHGVLRSIDCYLYSVYSIADTEGHELININALEHLEGDDANQTITRATRQEADSIFVDPLAHKEAAEVVFNRADEVGFLAELPARTPAEGLLTLIEWLGIEEVNDKLLGIITGKLVRVMCEKCKQAFRPHPRFLQRVGLPPETNELYRPFQPPIDEEGNVLPFEPCPKCFGTGCYGRVPLLEMLEMTDAIKTLAAEGPSAQQIRAKMKEEGQRIFQTDGLRLVTEGRVALEELQRVFRK